MVLTNEVVRNLHESRRPSRGALAQQGSVTVFHAMRRVGSVFGLDHRAWRSASRAKGRRRTSNPFSQVPAEVSLWTCCMMASGWWATDAVGFQPQDGGTRIEIKKSTDKPWDAILGQNDISVVPEQTYTLKFMISTKEGNSKPFNVTWCSRSKTRRIKSTLERSSRFQQPGPTYSVDLSVPVTNKSASLQLWVGGPDGAEKAKDRVVDLKDFSFAEATSS